ncbi:MAG TPA: glycoside hydrolase family 3 N-terminal domain-containing protein [Gemmatimonadaceae bacterium]|nr:glycoside hydrolase family 3 N-terminal domain-containing protein [Gemmatimonadaceae bacterium]
MEWSGRSNVGRAILAVVVTACVSTNPTPSAAPAPAPPPLRSAAPRYAGWSDSVLASLSLRDKAAQLVWPMVFGDFASTSSASWARTQAFLTTEHVGGIIMSVGGPMEIAEKINAMQRLSAVPLLVGADLEFGAGYRARGGYFLPNAIDLGGATIFPPEMGIGATRDTSLAYEQGRITAVEGRALGIHVAFAPILDVNNNPANPVIGVRSFGEDQRLDAALGAAMIRGLQEHGMIATGKHFPGHGDTDQNSHLTLPTITVSRARLDSVELVPFRNAIAAGIGAIMTAHIALPSILGDSSTPATLSPRIMTDLLRHELGFRGLLITDAMDMNGVLANLRPGRSGQVMTGAYGTIQSIGLAEACKRALEAGADVLLMPSDVPAAIDAVVAGVQEGRFTVARLDSSVRRLLDAKEQLGLNRNRLVDLDSVQAIVGDSNNLNVARRAAELSITLAKDSLHLVPLARGSASAQRVLAITLATRSDLGANVTFLSEMRRGLTSGVRLRTEYLNPDDAGTNYARLLAASDSTDLVLLCSYLAPIYSSASAAAAAPVLDFMRAIARRNGRVILVNFGNPYLYQQVPGVPAYLIAWGGFPVSQRAAAQALLGVNAIAGRLPISIPPLLPFGAGEMRPAIPAPSAPAVSRP